MTTNKKHLEHLKRFQSVLALALMIIALALMSDNFLTVYNSLNVLRQICVNLCLSIGMTIIILSGGIDLSVGSMLALAGAVSA
jgi:ribose transport system permease protein